MAIELSKKQKFLKFLFYILPHHAISRVVYLVTRLRGPQVKPMIRWFVKKYGVNMEDAGESEIGFYQTFNEFFTRELKASIRPLVPGDNTLACPCDGREYYPTSVMASLGNPIDTAVGLATGKPTPSDIRADLLQDIGQLKGQEFINNLLDVKSQGATFGSLTEREGAKLETYRQDMTTARSLPAFLEAANNLKGLLEKARARKAEASGIPETAMDLPSAIRTDESGIPTPESVQQINQSYEERVRRMSQ